MNTIQEMISKYVLIHVFFLSDALAFFFRCNKHVVRKNF